MACSMTAWCSRGHSPKSARNNFLAEILFVIYLEILFPVLNKKINQEVSIKFVPDYNS